MSSNSSDITVSVEGLGKKYWLPGHGSGRGGRVGLMGLHFKEYLSFLGKKRDEDYFWALKDMSFEVKRGEVLGILGMNGSGKSTLLKILSGVTMPSTGRATMHGRVGSLLEVGTGFHPDLTGRENVFLSGSLLGMSKAEIKSKFDEIVYFSGIEDFIDVPAKRYSSGMYVRLAYAVASNLDSDVLILDEVLAVGDAQFREKSRESMENASKQGKTILFVSHNISAVSQICTKGIVLSKGKLVHSGSIDEVVHYYKKDIHSIPTDIDSDSLLSPKQDLRGAPRHTNSPKDNQFITSVSLHQSDGQPTAYFKTGEDIRVRIGYNVGNEPYSYFTIFFLDQLGNRVMTVQSDHDLETLKVKGAGVIECVIPSNRLGSGEYILMLDYGRIKSTYVCLDCVPSAITVSISLGDYLNGRSTLEGQGFIAQKTNWIIK
ncbi:ABC transporter ATP-binding protein [Kiloniella majae]|uniref:ABC transporter ATP-binding protein n=1 Tax=Kiloniella majae TaxID=1938558 RepID=UPI000A277D0A|nr:ABC transporter ATP-binding protein [Kiloniella majae]